MTEMVRIQCTIETDDGSVQHIRYALDRAQVERMTVGPPPAPGDLVQATFWAGRQERADALSKHIGLSLAHEIVRACGKRFEVKRDERPTSSDLELG